MCGVEGHTSDRCENAKCLRCGLPNISYSHTGCMHCRRLNNTSCFLCGGKGHTKSNCPDTWRRFHATLSGQEGVVQTPDQGIERAHKELCQIWCSNCAKQGHYLHQCRAYNYSSYPKPVLHVVSYQDLVKKTDAYDEAMESSLAPINKRQKWKEALRE